MTPTLDFSTNWNGKLHTKVFHTLRRSGRHEPGDRVEVYLKDKLLGTAECIDRVRYDDIHAVPHPICWLDTGYSREDTATILHSMYKEDPTGKPIYGYLFQWMQTTGERKQLKRTVQLAMDLPF